MPFSAIPTSTPVPRNKRENTNRLVGLSSASSSRNGRAINSIVWANRSAAAGGNADAARASASRNVSRTSEHAAKAQRRGDGDRAAHAFDQLPADRQTQSRPAEPPCDGTVRLHERIEQPSQLVLGDANAGIGDRPFTIASPPSRSSRDLSSGAVSGESATSRAARAPGTRAPGTRAPGTRGPERGLTTRACTVTEPDLVNLTALETRLCRTCRMLPASPISRSGRSASCVRFSRRPFSAAPSRCTCSVSMGQVDRRERRLARTSSVRRRAWKSPGCH